MTRLLRPIMTVALALASVTVLGLAAPATAATSCVVTSNPLGAATGYTEFIAGDGHRGSESEGAIAWGGNLDANGMTVGTRLSSGATDPTLVVAGTHGTFNLQKGSAYVSPKSGVNFNGGQGAGYLSSNPIDFTSAFTTLSSRSTAWGAATATGTVTTGTVGGNQGYLILTGTDTTANYFTVTAAQLAAASGIAYDVPASATTLINVTGSSVTLQGQMWVKQGGGFNQVSDGTDSATANILWNFPTATAITMNFGSAWAGSILAPNATLTVNSVGHTIGQIVTKGFSSNFETHQNLFPTSACLPSTAVTPPSTANVKIAKTVDNASPRPGDTVTYTLTASNAGPASAANVTVTDTLPAGITFVSASAPCTYAAGTVSCSAGTLASGASQVYTVRATVNPVPTGTAAAQHEITVEKQQVSFALDAGQTQTVQVACQPGYVVLDGSPLVQAVDQGTGTIADVAVTSSYASDASTWTTTMTNHATGRAQGQVFAVCIQSSTSAADGHSHPIVVSAPVTQQAAAGTTTLSCAAGQSPVTPGYQLTSGALTASYPSGTTGWTFVTTGPGTLSIACLDDKVGLADGHQHDLALTTVTKTVTVQPGATVQAQLSCADDAKGIVAGWNPQSGLVVAGNEPQPKIRVFSISNPTGAALTDQLSLLCLGTKTAGGAAVSTVTNTASVATTTTESSTTDNSASASFTINTTPAPSVVAASPLVVVRGSKVATVVTCSGGRTTCAGTAALVASRTQRIAGHRVRAGTVLAKASYRVAAGHRTVLHLKATKAGRRVLHAKKLTKAHLRVGGHVRTVAVRH